MASITATPSPSREIKGRSLWQDARRRLFANRAAVAGMIVLAIIAFLSIVMPFVWPHEFDQVYIDRISCPPPDWLGLTWLFGSQGEICPTAVGQGHIFGTDANGRDLFIRVMHGGRVSLSIGLTATFVALLIGVLYGATAGYIGGRVDNYMMRIVDILYALPYIFFVIILVVVFGRNYILMFIAIGAVEWLTMARIVRGQTLSIKEREFIEAAKAGGAKPWTIIFRHIVPNLTGPVVIYATLTIPEIIITESFLSYLGLGVQEPQTSLGTLISFGSAAAEILPWMLIGPAVVLVVLLLCLTYIGDGLRDALDPKDR